MSLTEFLLARIAEDEAVARPLYVDAPAHLLREGSRDWVEATPGRIEAECEAKRQIVALHGPNGNGMTPGGDMCSEFEPWPCDTIRALALPYADHPDYREEWKP